ncbi:IS5 family transposase [Streptomyces phyllanthi]|uniref:IS5 family transposase n=1 Tax=Streptomyces phyllanthi TaxID=1803180 RepID=A0A5N8VTJ8_9ACTN|nr:IS5 family transposase [Streptomyces phyllanthi]MPY38560.1 IS5 family transposase [Streptomyces phyllanthi]
MPEPPPITGAFAPAFQPGSPRFSPRRRPRALRCACGKGPGPRAPRRRPTSLRRWRDKGLTAEFHDRLRDRVRQAAGRDPEPTAAVIDAQSVKAAASVPAVTRGFDGGKKVNGRKRHIVVDTLGLLLAVMVTAASVTDRDAGQALLDRLRERHWRITRVWADGGYTGRLVDLARDAWRIALTVVRRSDDTSGFTVLPKRWLVECTFAWLMHSRRLARDYETRTDTSEAVITWAMSTVMSRRLARRAR